MMTVKNAYKEVKKILVFNPSFIGDSVLTTPLISALQCLFPGAEVTFCVRPESASLFDGLDFGVVAFDKRKSDGGPAGMVRFAKRLRRMGFDMVISPHKSLRTSVVLKMAKIPFRIGFTEAAWNWLYTDVVSRDMSLHEAERNLSLLTPITDNYSLDEAKRIGGGLRTFKDADFAGVSHSYTTVVSEGKKVVGLNAGSVWNTKRWPVEYYAKTAEMLHEAGHAVAVFGGPADKEVNSRLKAMLDMEYFDYNYKVPFGKIPALISGLDLLITNDSAPLHIAVSQNVPVVAIFGPTVPALGFTPYDCLSIVCEIPDLPCRPCGLHGGKSCPEKHFKCMLDLQPESVFDAARKLLSPA